MATGSGREMVRRAAFYPRRGGGGVFWAGVRRREARLPRGVLSGWERRRWRASGGSGVRRSSSGGGGCGDDRPSRAGGAGLVLSWAGRWSVGVAARSSSGELVVVPSWWWWVPVSSSGWASSRIPRSSGTPLGYCCGSSARNCTRRNWLGNSTRNCLRRCHLLIFTCLNWTKGHDYLSLCR